MSFAWSPVLLSLLAVPLLLGAYIVIDRRRRRRTVVYSSVALLRAARPARSAWRRHVPFALVLAALAALGLAGARPQVSVDQPVAASSLILALDVSGSMCSTDVQPNRLSAAQAAVRDFVKAQDSRTRIGLVVFSGFAAAHRRAQHGPRRPAQGPRLADHRAGDGDRCRDPHVGVGHLEDRLQRRTRRQHGASGSPEAPGPEGPGGQTPAPRPGSYAPEIVVLLTDGANTRGITPVEAAKVAAARGVRVYPIGFGTTQPAPLVCTAEQLGGTGFGNFGGRNFGGGGPGSPSLVADAPTLRQVAAITGGAYFPAGGAGQLQDVLSDLPNHVQVQRRDVELTAGFAGLAAVLVLLSVAAAARWTAFPA